MMLSHSCVYNYTLLVYIGGEIMTLSELNEMFIRDYARYTRAYSEDELDIIFGNSHKPPKKIESSDVSSDPLRLLKTRQSWIDRSRW